MLLAILLLCSPAFAVTGDQTFSGDVTMQGKLEMEGLVKIDKNASLRNWDGTVSSITVPWSSLIDTREQAIIARHRSGKAILIPAYEYPASVATNGDWNYMANMARTHPDVQTYVIINPNSGPGTTTDNNWTEAILLMKGAGAKTLAYIDDKYAQKSTTTDMGVLGTWHSLYPDVDGVFLDEAYNHTDPSTVTYYSTLTKGMHQAGYYPIFLNAGASVPSVFSTSTAGDYFVVSETGNYPSTTTIADPYFGGMRDYDSKTKAVLSYSVSLATQTMANLYPFANILYATDSSDWSKPSTFLRQEYDLMSSVDVSSRAATYEPGAMTSSSIVSNRCTSASNCTATCPAGTVVVGGGVSKAATVITQQNYPNSATTWYVSFTDTSGVSVSIDSTIYAICVVRN